MATVYECLSLYCQQESKPILKQAERAQLGKTINKHYYNSGHSNKDTCMVYSDEPTDQGISFRSRIVNYPEHFTPFILALIHGFYIQRKRPRIKSKPRRILTEK